MLSPMRVLSLDTTGRQGSLALFVDGRPADVRVGDPGRTHGERLPGEIQALFDAHGLTARDVDVFAVAAGPGSFTGLRVGIATIQGLALVTGRPVVPVSTLEALAWSVRGRAGARLVGAWIDAQRQEVFGALYQVVEPAIGPAADRAPRFVEHAAPSVGRPAAVLEAWKAPAAGERVLFAGSGAVAYRDVILARGCGVAAEVLDEVPPLAVAIAEIAIARAAAGGSVLPHAIIPIYVRRSDAELARGRERNEV